MIIKRFNTILSKGEQKPCPTDLLFNPAYLTDTEWVSKTDAVPVLSLNGVDNYLNSDIIPYLCDTNNAWKIKTRFRFTARQGNNLNTIFSNRISTTNGIWLYYNTSSNALSFQIRKTATTDEIQIVTEQINIELNQFVEIEVSYDGSKDGNSIIIKLNNTQLSYTVTVNTLTSDLLLCNVFGLFTNFTTYPIVSYYSSVDIEYFTIQDGSDNYIARWVLTDLLDREGNYNLTLGGILTDCWSKRRVLLNNEDRTYLTNIEKVKAKLINSTCVQTNGLNNSLLISASEYVGNLIEGLNINITFQTTNDIKTGYYSAILTKRNATLGGSWGIVKSDTNNLAFVYYNQDNIAMSHPLLNIATNTLYDIKLQILNSYVIITINDNIVLNQLVDLTDFDLLLANFYINSFFFGGSVYLPLKLFKFESSVNQAYNSVIDFTYNTNNTCYNQSALNDVYTIAGDPVSIVKQDVLHSQLLNGFTKDGTNIYPPLLSNPLVDCVTGQPLTNPAKTNGHNMANTELDFSQYINIPLTEPYHPNDVTGFEDSQLFYRDRKPTFIDRFLLYANPITGDCLDKSQKYIS